MLLNWFENQLNSHWFYPWWYFWYCKYWWIHSGHTTLHDIRVIIINQIINLVNWRVLASIFTFKMIQFMTMFSLITKWLAWQWPNLSSSWGHNPSHAKHFLCTISFLAVPVQWIPLKLYFPSLLVQWILVFSVSLVTFAFLWTFSIALSCWNQIIYV